MDLNKRLSLVIEKDKKENPKHIKNVIKSDFYYLISNYFEVNFDDIDVNISFDQKKYIISVDCQAERIKMMKSLP